MDDLTSVLRGLAEEYFAPEAVAFASLGEDGGLALFPGEGEAVESRTRSVTGRVREICRYPFLVVWRTGALSEGRKAAMKERLEGFGLWLEQKRELPALSNGRLLSIGRTGSGCQQESNGNRTEGWVIHLAARYEIIF